jgi:cytochrome c553
MRAVIIAVTAVVLLLAADAGAGPLDTPGYDKAFSCSACHGPAGNSRTDAMPIIAGMSPVYFKKAIEDYAAGRRLSPEMEPYSKMVRELGIEAVAGYFAAQRREPPAGRVDRAAVARGRAAATQCAACHGEMGKGDAAKAIPDISGQPAGYLRNQLMLFKADRRSPGDEALTKMKALLKQIPDDTLGDLAAYYSSLGR